MIKDYILEAMDKALAEKQPVNGKKPYPINFDLWNNGWCRDCNTHTQVFSHPSHYGSEAYYCTTCRNVTDGREGAWWRKVEDLPEETLSNSFYLVLMPYYYGKGKSIAEAAKNCRGDARSKDVIVYHFLSTCPLAFGDISVNEMGGTSWHNDTRMTRIIEGGVTLASLRREGSLAKGKRPTLFDIED